MAATGAAGGGFQAGDHRPTPSAGAGQRLRTTTSIADLQRILAATSETQDAGAADPWHAALDEADRARLIAAVRQRGAGATLDIAMASDLVAAVMPGALAAIAADERSKRLLMERIAQSLLDDPASCRRLQLLFDAIKAAAQVGPPPAEHA